MAKTKKLHVFFNGTHCLNDKMTVALHFDDLGDECARAYLLNKQVSAKLNCDPNAMGDADGQETMYVGELEVEMIGDIGSYRTSPGKMTCSIKGQAPDYDSERGKFTRFSKKAGTITLTVLGSAKAEDDGDDD